MSLADRFRAFLHPTRLSERATRGILARLDALDELVARLTEREIAHDVAWSEAKEQISRHLKRVVEVERRQGKQGSGISPLTQQLIDLKLRKPAGG